MKRYTLFLFFWVGTCAGLAGIAFLVSPGVVTGAGQQRSRSLSSYIGGSGDDTIRDVAVDVQGNIYLTGGTASPNFPVGSGSFDTHSTGFMMYGLQN